MTEWLVLITNLPGRNQTLRMRQWRGLRSAGAASLRDGVYLLPDSASNRRNFETRSGQIRAAGGSACLLPCVAASPDQGRAFHALFDRSAAYGELLKKLDVFRRQLPRLTESVAVRSIERLQRELAQVVAIDFFPDASLDQASGAMRDVREAQASRFSTGEPQTVRRRVVRLNRRDYARRTWVTRKHLWVDRACSAWLIKRFIDPKAKFQWLKDVRRRPRSAIGFDFDGAQFTHADSKVTFEVLLHSFGLEQDVGLAALAAVVHYLDVGGVPTAEAAGVAAIFSGVRALGSSDDELLRIIGPLLDSLYAAFSDPKAS
jgi:hypothetical protein